MADNQFIQRQGYSVKRNTSISDQIPLQPSHPIYPTLGNDPQASAPQPRMSGSPIHDKMQSIMDAMDELGIQITNPMELIIKDYKEYVLIKDLRRRAKEETLKEVKGITSKYRKHL